MRTGAGTSDDPGELGDLDLAIRARGGDDAAFGLLFERWFDRAYDVAWHIVRNRDTAAEVAQEAFTTAWQEIGQLRQPESFGGWLLRITRNKGLNRLQRDRLVDPIGDEVVMEGLRPAGLGVGESGRPGDPGDSLADQERDDLVWVAAAALGPDDASLLNLHLRHGLGAAELADELGTEPNAVHQRLFRLRQRLGDTIGAWVLWHRGTPACSVLRQQLHHAGRTTFSRPTVATIGAHLRAGCSGCDADRKLQLSPEALFAAIPLVPAGSFLRAQAAAALQATGTPSSIAGLEPTSGPTGNAGPDSTGGPAGSQDGPTGDGSPTGTDPSPPGGQGGPSEAAGRPPEADAGAWSGGGPDPSHSGDAGGQNGANTAIGSGPAGSGRRRSVVLAALAVLILVVGVLALAARTGDDAPTEPAAAEAGLDADFDPGPAPPPPTAPEVGATTGPQESATTTTADVATDPSPPDPPDNESSTTTEPTGPAPVIGGFRASRGTLDCSVTDEVAVRFAWSSTGATSATLGPDGTTPQDVRPSGSLETCSTAGTVWTLSVTGPGGTTTQTAPAPELP